MQVGFTVFVSRFNYDQGARGLDPGRGQPDPALQFNRPAEPAQLRFGFARIHYVPQLPAEAEFSASGYQLRFQHPERDYPDRCRLVILRLHKFPADQRAAGEFIERDSHIEHYPYLQLQLREQSSSFRRPAPEYQMSFQFAGSVLGGNVNQMEPVLDIRHYRKGFKPGHVIVHAPLGEVHDRVRRQGGATLQSFLYGR